MFLYEKDDYCIFVFVGAMIHRYKERKAGRSSRVKNYD